MTLTTLIQKLSEMRSTADCAQMQEIATKTIILPGDFEQGEIEVKNLNFGNKGSSPLYHLLIASYPKRSIEDVQPIIDELSARAKRLSIGRGIMDVERKFFWTPEDFLREKKLTGLFMGGVDVSAIAYEADPSKVRIGMNAKTHHFEAEANANQLTIKATGNYRPRLGQVLTTIKPQLATLRVSKEDAQRALTYLEREGSMKLRAMLQKALKPEKKSVIRLSMGGGIGFGEEDVIELKLFTRLLPQFEKLVGKPLLRDGENDQTRVIALTRVYGLIDLMRGKQLVDLQGLASLVQDADIGIPFDHPVLTLKGAQELLEQEIQIAKDSYKMWFYFGPNTHLARGPIVKRLAADHFGVGILQSFDKLSAEEYSTFLQQQGYAQERVEQEPAYITKEKHLLAFFLQSCARDPKASIEAYRNWYVYRRPIVEIVGAPGRIDGSRIRTLRSPSKAKMYGFGVKEQMNAPTGLSNDACISRTRPSSDGIQFWCRTSLDSPLLLPLQEYLCDAAGIRFE